MEHKLILGGHEYLPFARSCVTKLKGLGITHANQVFEVGGASIKVRIEPGHEHIRIESGVYMESGVLDLHELQFGRRDAYLPATIKLTPFVSGLMEKPTKMPNAGTRAVKDGDGSLSASGCSGKIEVVDTIVGNNTNVHFESNPAEFCDPDKMKAFKRIFESIPSSTYTGKLKLFVQALYGSKRTDYRAGGFSGQYLEVSTGKFTTPPPGSSASPTEIFASLTNGYPTHGLLTIPDKAKPGVKTNKYALVEIGIDAVTYRKMRLPGAVPRIKDKGHNDLLEAFRLSTLVPDADNLTSVGPSLSEFTNGWSRLAHGWHFNKAGTEASIVLLRAKTISGISFKLFNPTSIGGYEFIQYKVSLVWVYETDTVPAHLTHNITEIARGDHIPFLQTKVFTPNLIANRLDLLIPTGSDPAGSWDCWANLTAPLYCYYDSNDTLITVTVNNTAPTISPGEVTPTSTMDELTGSAYVTEGRWISVNLPESHFVADNGVTVGSVPIKGSSRRYYEPTFRSITVISSDNASTPYILTGVGGSFMINARNDDEAHQSTVTCVIPFGDASAVVAGLERNVTGTYDYTNLLWFGNNVPFMDPFSDPPYSEPNPWSVVAMIWVPDAATEESESRKRDYTPSPSSITSHTALYAAGREVALSDFYATWFATEPVPPRDFEGLFNPLAGSAPYYAYPMTVRTSYSDGALQHLFCEPTLNPDKPDVSLFGWPDARWSAAVGWA